jgi:hypothetical protein
MRKRSKGFKEVNVCIHLLQEVQAGGALDPRQKEKLGRAIATLGKANRRDARTERQVLGAVRVIAEVLWEAFSRESKGTRAE